MKLSIKKIILCTLLIALFFVPNLAFAQKNNTTLPLTDEQITKTVKQAVKEHGEFTAPIIVDTELVDPEDGSMISFYIFPKNIEAVGDFSPFAITPIASHTIKQGVKMIYSRYDGEPWTVDIDTTITLWFDTDQPPPTYMRYGHLNADSGSTIFDHASYGYDFGYGYTGLAQATHIRFFIENKSATDVVVTGEIKF